MGTALIVLSWTLFPSLGWALWISIVCTVVGAFVALFALLFIVYFFNLDMKLMAKMEPILTKVYDKRERNRKI